jgi:NitT/TauT family transport system substrate-binding protein
MTRQVTSLDMFEMFALAIGRNPHFGRRAGRGAPAPSPACGGGLGRGLFASICALDPRKDPLASESAGAEMRGSSPEAPSPTLPRKREREQARCAVWLKLMPAVFALTAGLLIYGATCAHALDTVRLGKAVPNSFAFAAAEVGIDAKIFEGEGLEVTVSSFRGDAQMQQALAAGGLDVGLGSGPGLGFRIKGAPAIGVAAMYGPPANLALLVSAKGPIRTIADLKGKRIGVTTAGSLTDWLVRELSRQQGWGSTGIGIAALGQMQARLAAMDRGELDGIVLEAANGYELEEAGRTRNLILFGDIVKHFYTHVIFATDDMIAHRPEVLRRFLRGWFKTVAFMRANRDFTIKSTQRTLDVRQGIIEKIYDAQIGGFSADGAWDPEAIDVIRASLKDVGTLPTIPDAKALYNDTFVPVRF